MQHLHNLIARLYPGWPRALIGHRVQIHLADEARGWLHIETDDGGLESPVQGRALHHLHVSGEFTGHDGTTRQPVACLSVLAPTGLVTDEPGPIAFTPECVPFSYFLTAFGREDDPASMQRIWTRNAAGTLLRRRNALRDGVALLREWDDAIGQQWRP